MFSNYLIRIVAAVVIVVIASVVVSRMEDRHF
jgi:hypothetical protein